MVHLDIVCSCNADFVRSQPLVAVFVGCTAGIGSYAVRALAAHAKDGKGLRLYIVGRNKAAAEKITSELLNVCPTGQFRLVHTDDLALLKSMDRVCAEIIRSEQEVRMMGEMPRVDLLVMTRAYLAFKARGGTYAVLPREAGISNIKTKEGLDAIMSLLYYSRMRFIT
jgi:NAD(P)-dependent dehydrogenase (short-subunit alcohol dehydrogenase family)